MNQTVTNEPYPSLRVQSALRQLSNLCTWYTTGLETPKERFEQINEKIKGLHELFRDLGVSASGFIYLDQDRQIARYTFVDGVEASVDPTRNFMLPYQNFGWMPNVHRGSPGPSGKHVDKLKRFITALFDIHRASQNPFGDDPALRGEFLQDLPIGKVKTRSIAGERASDAWVRNNLGIHYVPYGEMLAYVLMWRRLLRRLARDASDPWPAVCKLDLERCPYERDLAKLLTDKHVDYLPQESHQIVAPLIRDIENGEGGEGTWDRDVRNLFPCQEDTPIAIKLLKRFCNSINVESPITRSAGDLEQLADSLLERPDTCALARDTNKPNALVNALAALHATSRFPILPYYYWAAASRRMRTAAVIPIWASITSPLYKPIEHPIVGMAVVVVDPLDHLELADPTPGVNNSDVNRLSDIITVIRLISLPQIDSYFYGVLKAEKDRVDATRVMLSSFGHDSKKPAELAKLVLSSSTLEIGSDQRIKVAEKVVNDLIVRMTAYTRLVDNGTKQSIKHASAWNEGSSKRARTFESFESIMDIWHRELEMVLLQLAFNTEGRWSDIHKKLKFPSNDYISAICDKIDDPIGNVLRCCVARNKKGADLVTPIRIKTTNSNSSSVPQVASALQFLFAEFIMNAFKHEFWRSDQLAQLRFGLEMETAQVEQIEHDVYPSVLATLRCSLAPASIEDDCVAQGIMGLTSIKSVANSIGATVNTRTVLGASPPAFPDRENGSLNWTLSSVPCFMRS